MNVLVTPVDPDHCGAIDSLLHCGSKFGGLAQQLAQLLDKLGEI